jgi:hypothetical protein
MSFLGALESVRRNDGPLFVVKGGVSIELRLGLRARTTKDLDLVFRGDPEAMLDALEDALSRPYGSFAFRRKGLVEDIRDTGSRRLAIQVLFGGREWQTLQLEVAPPEADEIELVPAAISIADFKLDGPERVACLSLRYQIAQKLHAVTERPTDRANQRFWDLIDLILLEELGDDLARVREASVEIFERRRTHSWPPELVAPAAWIEPYRATAAEIGADLPEDVEEAAEIVRMFIAAIDRAV